MKKRILSIVTALALCLMLCPAGAWAAEGDDAPADNTLSALPDNTTLSSVTGIAFKQAYQNKLNKTYNKTAAEAPNKSDLIFWVGDQSFDAPADSSNIDVALEPTWYSGSSANGTALSGAPVNAGTYTLSIRVTLTKGGTDADGTNTTVETGTPPAADLTFTIAQKKLTPEISGTFTKQYDGTLNFEPPAGTSPISVGSGEIVAADKVTVKGEYSFSGASVSTDGEEYPYTFYANNLELEGDDKDNYTLGGTTRLSKPKAAKVTKAKLPVSTPNNAIVLRNRREHTYTFDLSRVLPALPSGQQYMADNDNSKITYSLEPGSIKISYPSFFEMADANSSAADAICIEGSTLTVKAKNAPYDESMSVATVEVSVKTDNFDEFQCTIELVSANKTQVEIGGLTPVRAVYDGSQEIGYVGTPVFTLSDITSSEEITGLTGSNLRCMYESTVQSATKYGPTAEAPAAPGVYRVTISIDSEDYTGTKELEFTITKAKVTVTAVTRNINVDDPVPSLASPVLGVDYTVTGLAGDDQLKIAPTLKYATVADSIMEGEFDILIDGAMVPDNTNYDAAITYVPGKLIVGALTNKQDNPFSDVSEHAWYVTAVKYVYNMGLMKGTTSTLFSPTGNLTRGQAVTILYRMEDEPPVWQTTPFTDLAPDAYYVNAVRWASSNRIVNGYGDGCFGPDDVLTREQLAIILYNFTRYRGEIPDKIASLDAFVDVDRTTPQGYRALQWACAEGLLQGTGSNTMSPRGQALRAQVAVILMRYCTNVLGLEEP